MMMQLTNISDLIVCTPKTNILYYHFFPLKQIELQDHSDVLYLQANR